MEFQTHRALGETGAVTPAHLNIPSPPPFCLIEMEPRNITKESTRQIVASVRPMNRRLTWNEAI